MHGKRKRKSCYRMSASTFYHPFSCFPVINIVRKQHKKSKDCLLRLLLNSYVTMLEIRWCEASYKLKAFLLSHRNFYCQTIYFSCQFSYQFLTRRRCFFSVIVVTVFVFFLLVLSFVKTKQRRSQNSFFYKKRQHSINKGKR